jgi:hypothetical protein
MNFALTTGENQITTVDGLLVFAGSVDPDIFSAFSVTIGVQTANFRILNRLTSVLESATTSQPLTLVCTSVQTDATITSAQTDATASLE